MADPHASDPPTSQTAEFRTTPPQATATTPPKAPPAEPTATTPAQATTSLPARHHDLRDHLPGLEPERHLTDWGRSERIEGLIDRTLYDFLYHYWFRVEVQGIENVPADGGALLVANHAGAIPPDAAMIAKAIRVEHPQRRPVHFTTEPRLSALPGLGMILTKVGAVADHPANLHRLLFDERQLVLVFPEGRGANRKPLKERYRLQGFDHAGYVKAAARAGVPIVPVAVLGAEEAVPVLARIPLVKRLTLTPGLPLPAKFRIRFLEPVDVDDAPPEALSHEIRALIQENLLELVAHRRSVWLG